jgi:hypothetical protein
MLRGQAAPRSPAQPDRDALRRRGRQALPVKPPEGLGAENPVTSCDLQVLVYEAAESTPSQWPGGRVVAREPGGVRQAGGC